MKIKFYSKNENDTINIAKKIAQKLKPNTLIYLNGDLASGKTTFTKGLGVGLNIKNIINSPTFTILKIYDGNLKLYHIDAYRLEGISYDLGFDELINDDGVVVIEWSKYIENNLRKPDVIVDFIHINDNEREITINYDENKINLGV